MLKQPKVGPDSDDADAQRSFGTQTPNLFDAMPDSWIGAEEFAV